MENKMKTYLRNRFYLRGTTRLGLLNTLFAFLANRVFVRHLNEQGKTIRWSIKRGTDFPPAEMRETINKQERLLKDARNVAREILSFAVAPGNGGYVSCFGTATYSRLVDLVTGGVQNYCQENGHIKHAELDRCIICCKPCGGI